MIRLAGTIKVCNRSLGNAVLQSCGQTSLGQMEDRVKQSAEGFLARIRLISVVLLLLSF